MQRVIVFGGRGLVGTSLLTQLEGSEYTVISPCSREVDLTSRKSLSKFVRELKKYPQPISIIFLAAIVPYNCDIHDNYDHMSRNADMAHNLTECFQDVEISEIIYISTLDVYGKPVLKITENTKLNPISNYAIFKTSAEFLLKTFAKAKNIPLCILRLSHVYGVNDKSPKVINKFFQEALEKSRIVINVDGNTLRDFIYVDDVAKVIAFFTGKRINETLNVATGNSVTLSMLAESVKNCVPTNVSIVYTNSNSETNHSEFDIERLRKYYKPNFTAIEDVIPLLYKAKMRLH